MTERRSEPMDLASLRRRWRVLGGDAAARAEVMADLLRSAPDGHAGPDDLGAALEALTPGDARRRAGVHHTPPAIADGLVAVALAPPVGVVGPPAACDPAVGGGAFLLAVARAARGQGHDAEHVLAGLHGADTDPLAVEVTRAALRVWAIGEGANASRCAELVQARILVQDGLDATAATWSTAPEPGFDLVVGNPPFLGQLADDTARRAADRRRLRERFGGAATGYVDTAGLFLLLALDLARAGGVVALVLPESILATRDAAGVRARATSSATLHHLWVAGERVFGADVRVCAPVLVANGPGRGDPADVQLWQGAGFEPVVRIRAADLDPVDRLHGLVAAAYGTPPVRPTVGQGTVRDRATATAGFREQFYGLAPHVREAQPGSSDDTARLVTTGAIDPLHCGWGEQPVRFAGQRWSAPVVDRRSLAATDPRLDRWVGDRLVPKLLVATQTKVIEVVVDAAGRFVPSVPVIAVTCPPEQLWALAAALLAPITSAWALHRAGGTALAADTVKLSARQVLDVPLPVDDGAWAEAASALAADGLGPQAFARLMGRAYALADADPVGPWWLGRLRTWRGEPVTPGS